MKLWSSEAWRRSRKWRSYFLVVFGAYALTLAVATLFEPLRENLENLVFDQYQRWRPRPYNLDQPVRIVDIDDEFDPPHRSMALAAPDHGGSRRHSGEGECRRDRLRRPLFRERPADRRTRPACRRAAVHSADDVERCEERADGDVALRARDRRPSGRARRLPPPHSRGRAGEPDDEGGLFLHRGSAEFVPQPVQRARSCRFPRWRTQPAASAFSTGCPTTTGSCASVPLVLDLNGQIQPSLALETLRVAQGATGYRGEIDDRHSASTAGKSQFARGDQGRRRDDSGTGRRRTCACGSQGRTRAGRSRPGKSFSPTPISPILPARSCSSAPALRCWGTSSRPRSTLRRQGWRRTRSSSNRSCPA